MTNENFQLLQLTEFIVLTQANREVLQGLVAVESATYCDPIMNLHTIGVEVEEVDVALFDFHLRQGLQILRLADRQVLAMKPIALLIGTEDFAVVCFSLHHFSNFPRNLKKIKER